VLVVIDANVFVSAAIQRGALIGSWNVEVCKNPGHVQFVSGRGRGERLLGRLVEARGDE